MANHEETSTSKITFSIVFYFKYDLDKADCALSLDRKKERKKER